MTDTIDIVCVGGPANGRIYNIPTRNNSARIPVAPSYVEVAYVLRTFAHDGMNYRVACYNGDESNSDIIAAIVSSGITPQWSVNR